MKIIITGATGSLGAYLTRWFSQKGHEVIGTGRVATPPPGFFQYANYLRADITNNFSLPEADVCIHTAAIADDKTTRNELFKANVTGTIHTADAAKKSKTFIHVSTSSVYASINEPLTEEMAGERPGQKLSGYGHSKLLAENALAERYQNDSCFILRPRAIYGAGDKVLLPRLIKLVRNGTLLRPGSMMVKISMTHFQNFALAVENCIHSEKKGLHIYNVADGKTYVLYDAIKKLLNELYSRELPEKKIPLWILKAMSVFKIGDATPLFIKAVSKDTVLDISKIRKELHYSPVADFDQSITGICDWVKSIGGIEVLKTAAPVLAWEPST